MDLETDYTGSYRAILNDGDDTIYVDGLDENDIVVFEVLLKEHFAIYEDYKLRYKRAKLYYSDYLRGLAVYRDLKAIKS